MSKQKELQESKTELDKIFEFLKQQGGFKFNKETKEFVKEMEGRPSQIIINGQATVQRGPKQTIKIKYVGEGSISQKDDSENSIPIWGFEIEQDEQSMGPTEYVDSFEQFVDLFR